MPPMSLENVIKPDANVCERHNSPQKRLFHIISFVLLVSKDLPGAPSKQNLSVLTKRKGPPDTLHKLSDELGLFSNIINLGSYHQQSHKALSKRYYSKLFELWSRNIQVYPVFWCRKHRLSKTAPTKRESQVKSTDLESVSHSSMAMMIRNLGSFENLLQKAHNT